MITEPHTRLSRLMRLGLFYPSLFSCKRWPLYDQDRILVSRCNSLSRHYRETFSLFKVKFRVPKTLPNSRLSRDGLMASLQSFSRACVARPPSFTSF